MFLKVLKLAGSVAFRINDKKINLGAAVYIPLYPVLSFNILILFMHLFVTFVAVYLVEVGGLSQILIVSLLKLLLVLDRY